MSDGLVEQIKTHIRTQIDKHKSKTLSQDTIHDEKMFRTDVKVVSKLLDQTDEKSKYMNDAFRPFFELYLEMIQLDPGIQCNCFPFNKSKLPNKIMDKLDDVLHMKINVMFQKIYDKPGELRRALKTLTPNDWVVMTFSRASSPFVHAALNAFQCRPDSMEVLLKSVPTPVWFCPWNLDEFQMTPIQSLAWYIWHFNPKSAVRQQTDVHKQVKLNMKMFKLSKLKQVPYGYDQMCMFSGVSWYTCLDINLDTNEKSILDDYTNIEYVELRCI